MEPLPSAIVVEPEAVEFVTWPVPGTPGAWGEMAVVGVSSRAFPLSSRPYATRQAPASSSSDLLVELSDWLAAGMVSLASIDSYIDALDEDDSVDGEG